MRWHSVVRMVQVPQCDMRTKPKEDIEILKLSIFSEPTNLVSKDEEDAEVF